jgi:hypothetical protein
LQNSLRSSLITPCRVYETKNVHSIQGEIEAKVEKIFRAGVNVEETSLRDNRWSIQHVAFSAYGYSGKAFQPSRRAKPTANSSQSPGFEQFNLALDYWNSITRSKEPIVGEVRWAQLNPYR